MVSANKPTRREQDLQRENEELKIRLDEAEETLRAIREGEVDALVISGSKGDQVFSLFGAESTYRLIVDTMREAAFTVTFEGKILYCNNRFGEFVGQPMAQIIGHSLQEFVSDDYRDTATSLLSRAQSLPVQQRLVFQSPDGRAVPAHVAANVLNQPNETSICVVASDLTELENSTELIQQLRLQQEALRDSESRFKAVFLASNDAILLADDNGTYIDANPAAERLFGLPLDRLMGTKIAQWTGPGEDFEALWSTFQREGCYQGEIKLVRSDGAVIDAEATAIANILPGRHLAVVRDITGRKRAEDALLASERRYRSLFESMDEGFCVIEMLFDENGKPNNWIYSEVNPAFERHIGLYQAVGKTIRELVPDIEERWFEIYGKVAVTGEVVRLVDFSKEFNRWFDLSAFRVGNPEEHKVAILFNNITERKRAEEALQESEERFRQLFQDDLTGDFIANPDGQILFCNPAFLRIFGFSSQEAAIGSNLRNLHLHPGGFADFIELLKYHQSLDHYETERRRRDGRIIHIIENVVGTFSDRGELTQLKGYVFDDTERKHAEDALKRSEHRFRTFFESHIIGTLFWHMDGRITEANGKFLEMVGYTREELNAGRVKWSEMTPPEYRHLDEQAIANLKKTGSSIPYEKEYIRKNGTRMPVILGTALLNDNEGIAFVLDVTDRKRAEKELAAAKESAERAKAEAEQANRTKDHFLAVLSHELRTPLTPVMMGVSILQNNPDLDAKARETLETVRSNVDMEARLIDDLLDVTRIARGKIELNRTPVELCTVIQRAVDVCKPDIEGRRLHFGVDLGPGAPYWIEGDVSRLQQVFWNLLKNAIKFTPHGGCVGIRCRPSDDHVLVEVNDSGIGIEPEALPRVFNAFEQVERSVTQRFGGLGLGLAISKALVEMHGGEIEAHSEGRGKGATFRIRLPLRAPARKAETYLPAASPKQMARALHILLVEDHGVTAQMIRMVLTEKGHKVEISSDVATALELADRHAFDLLVSDLGLPDGSGHDLLRELYGRGHTFPAIALSGYGQEDDIRRSHEAGFATHLTKPVSREAVMEAVASATADENAAGIRSSSRQQPDPLVFDAEAAVRRCFGRREMLEQMVNFFQQDSSEQLSRIRAALGNGQFGEISKAAHRLKGSLVYLEAQPAANAAVKVEQAAKSEDPVATEEAIRNLESQVEVLKKALAAHTNPGV